MEQNNRSMTEIELKKVRKAIAVLEKEIATLSVSINARPVVKEVEAISDTWYTRKWKEDRDFDIFYTRDMNLGVFKSDNFYRNGVLLDVTSPTTSLDLDDDRYITRLADEREVTQVLINEAIKRGLNSDDITINPSEINPWRAAFNSGIFSNFKYDDESKILWVVDDIGGKGAVWEKGSWATVESKDIEFGGYKMIEFKDHVDFGCKHFKKSDIHKLRILCNNFNIDSIELSGFCVSKEFINKLADKIKV